jgi:hypothetical protein
MPFKSKAQARKCFALKARGKAKGWNCEEWASHTNFSKLPERKSSADYRHLLKQANQAAAAAAASQLLRRSRDWLNPRSLQRFARDWIPGARKWSPLVYRYASPLIFNPIVAMESAQWLGRGLGSLVGMPELGQLAGLGLAYVTPSVTSLSPQEFASRYFIPFAARRSPKLSQHNERLARLYSSLSGATGALFGGHSITTLLDAFGVHLPWWAPYAFALGGGMAGWSGNPVTNKGLWPNAGIWIHDWLGGPFLYALGLGSSLGSEGGKAQGQLDAMNMLNNYVQSMGMKDIGEAASLLEQYGPLAQKLQQLSPDERERLMQFSQRVDPNFLKFVARFV